MQGQMDAVVGEVYKLDVHKEHHWDREKNQQESPYTVKRQSERRQKTEQPQLSEADKAIQEKANQLAHDAFTLRKCTVF